LDGVLTDRFPGTSDEDVKMIRPGPARRNPANPARSGRKQR